MTLLNIIIGTSLMSVCTGDSAKTAVSSLTFHREDIPLSYEYSFVHIYDNENKKRNINEQGNNYHYQKRSQPYNNIQYAPLSPIEQENYRTFNTKVSIPGDTHLSDISITEASTGKNSIEPLEQYADSKLHNRNAISLQDVAGYNIKLDPIINQIEYKNEQKSRYGKKFAFPVKNTYDAVKNNIFQSYPHIKLRQPQEIASFPKYTSVTGINEPLPTYKASDLIHEKPIQSLQTLSSLEITRIQPPLNPYYYKAPKLHLNIARAHKIAHNLSKGPSYRQLTIHKRKSKQSFVPEAGVLLEQR